MPESTATPQQPPTPAPWPDGVIARYLTVAGAPVDLTDRTEESYWRYDTACGGCPHKDSFLSVEPARRDAQAHAERCRALPRPEDAR
ncbi:hypothetical protein CFC35_05660 [Streptomyces sp. FBKL.4005]|uniref:hypothetical protein n=1 Tax=Streptomyces TaxID=1883 RepID=UPI000A37E224|nr:MULTISPECIES: hypothetical protein [Streptomyces]OYP14051.1 hypothetical protein CFC35_05660 [Streptomyces sp. FBKL.4005]